MATLLRQEKLTKEQVAEVYEAAGTAAGKEIEPRLLYALLMLKQKEPTEKERKERADNVIKLCQEISAEHAELALPAQLMAWVQFEKHRYQTSIDELSQMVSKIPPPKTPADLYPELTQRIFRWAGQLREFASMVPANQRPPSEDSLKALDAAVAERGADALRAYDQGREKTRGIDADYDSRINEADAAGDKPTAAKFKVERRQLSNYVTYPFDDGGKSVLSTVDQ